MMAGSSCYFRKIVKQLFIVSTIVGLHKTIETDFEIIFAQHIQIKKGRVTNKREVHSPTQTGHRGIVQAWQ